MKCRPWAFWALFAACLLGVTLVGGNALAADGPLRAHYRVVLSSGLFAIPAGAHSVDWAVANHSAQPRKVRVTVYKYGIGAPRAVVPPGALEFTVDPGSAYHNANNVGADKPFVPGFYYEVVMESNSPQVLPIVHVWQDAVNTVIPGTLIPSGSWSSLRW